MRGDNFCGLCLMLLRIENLVLDKDLGLGHRSSAWLFQGHDCFVNGTTGFTKGDFDFEKSCSSDCHGESLIVVEKIK